MKVKELIEMFRGLDGDTEVKMTVKLSVLGHVRTYEVANLKLEVVNEDKIALVRGELR